MVLLMRYAGLRISDVVTVSREHIHGRYLVKRAVKNNKLIRVELPSAALEALDQLPPPKAAAMNNKRYFSSDTTGLRSLVKGAWRTMDAVFKRSGVKGAHPHRFRHTLVSELLGILGPRTKAGDPSSLIVTRDAILKSTAGVLQCS